MWLDKDVPRTVQEVRTQTNGVRVAAESAAKDAKDAAYLAGLAAGQKGEQERVAAMLGKAESAAQRLEQLKVDKR